MSLVTRETVQVSAAAAGVSNLGADVAEALAPDVEYRMREIVQVRVPLPRLAAPPFPPSPSSLGAPTRRCWALQEAVKCMRHAKRCVLTTEDVNSALSLRNVERLYGFQSSDSLRFCKALGHSDLYYVDDRDLDFREIVEAPLPRPPLDTSVVAHWLAVEGVQPAIPENSPLETAPAQAADPARKDASARPLQEEAPVEVKSAVKHVLSKELQLYFQKVTEMVITAGGGDSQLLGDVLASLATDSGIHPLVPYFMEFVAAEVTGGLDDLSLLDSLMRVVQSLLQNPHIHLELYLHQLMPIVITCIVAKRLGGKAGANHWELRDFSAGLLALICRKFGHAYQTLQPRVTKTLMQTLLDAKRALTQHYGAIRALTALGTRVFRTLVLPNLAPYLQLLLPELARESQPNRTKWYEAWRVYAALQQAAGQCVYELLRARPELLARGRLLHLRGPKVATSRCLPTSSASAPMEVAPTSAASLTPAPGAADAMDKSSCAYERVPDMLTSANHRAKDSAADIGPTADSTGGVVPAEPDRLAEEELVPGQAIRCEGPASDVEEAQAIATASGETLSPADHPSTRQPLIREDHSRELTEDTLAVEAVRDGHGQATSAATGDAAEHVAASLPVGRPDKGTTLSGVLSLQEEGGSLASASRNAETAVASPVEPLAVAGERLPQAAPAQSAEGALANGPETLAGTSLPLIQDARGHGAGAAASLEGPPRDNQAAATLLSAWREDVEAGKLLAALVVLFGEGMLPFAPSPQLQLIL
eukprot:SM000162S02398  [mRNA]  locus=s162:315977:320001:- [translate_table: standard]